MALYSPNLWSKYWVSMAPQGKKLGEPRRRWRHGSRAPAYRLITNAKNYCNRTLIVKVIVENVVTCFFGTQCTNTYWPVCLFCISYS